MPRADPGPVGAGREDAAEIDPVAWAIARYRPRLERRSGREITCLSPAAREDLVALLTAELEELLAPLRRLESRAWDAARPGLDRLAAPAGRSGPPLSWTRLRRQYPPVASIVTRLGGRWVGWTLEFVRRAAADAPALCPGPTSRSRVVRVRATDSDPHDRGRRVLAVELADGRVWMYKPRCVRTDLLYDRMAERLNREVTGGSLGRMEIVARPGYGWIERQDEVALGRGGVRREQLRGYGKLIALAHALGTEDAHRGNVLLTPSGPALVDTETLIHVPGRFSPPTDEATPSKEALVATGLLPAWIRGREGYRPVGGLPVPNAPDLRQIVIGFERTYEYLRTHRCELASPGGPLRDVRAAEFRVVLRPTSTYARALNDRVLSAVAGDRARSEKVLGGATPTPSEWPDGVRARERRALARGEVPRFTVLGSETSLRERSQPLSAELLESPWSVVSRRLRALTARDRERQAAILRGIVPDEGPSARADRRPAEWFEAEARRIGAVLLSRAFEDEAGRCQWLDVVTAPDGCVRHWLTETGLYRGKAGIAVFLAALADATGDQSTRRFSRRLVTELAAQVRETLERDAARRRGGLAVGPFSDIYALTLCADLAGDSAWSDEATWLADRACELGWAASSNADLMTGEAGSLLALCALGRSTPAIEERLASGAERLRRAASATDFSLPAGLAHGTAGLSLALSRLGGHLADRRLSELADRLRRLDPPRYGARGSWCHGLPGEAAVALEALERTDDARTVSRLGEQLGAMPRARVDHLCCGEFGTVETLAVIGRRTGAARWWRLASERAAATLARAHHEGGHRFRSFSGSGPRVRMTRPGLFRGLAGIGYSLLRLSRAPALPGILIWEARGGGGERRATPAKV